jgi:hypothetical protein
MTDFEYTRRFAAPDSIVVNNNNGSWDITRPADISQDPTRLWLRIPDTSEGVQKLMDYNWDEDTWTDITPE